MLATQQQYSNILNPANPNEHYHVPKYQRAYSWGQTNWEKLFDDISDNDPGHFIGSIICVRNDAHTQPGFDTIYELIDGQQRMTTLSLFLTAIYAKFGQWIELNRASLDEDELNEINAKKINLGRQIIRRIQSGSLANQPGCFKNAERHLLLRVQPSAQESNLDDYKYIMNLAGLLTAEKPSPSHFGNRRMAKAYYYFVNRLKDYGSQELERLCEKINQLMLVHIRVESNSDAFRLFETLNNRGVPLTAIDIIKNKMLAEMEHQKHADIDTSFDRWQTLIRRIDGNEDRFLRQYYNAFKHLPLVRVDRVTRATSSVLIKISVHDKNHSKDFLCCIFRCKNKTLSCIFLF